MLLSEQISECLLGKSKTRNKKNLHSAITCSGWKGGGRGHIRTYHLGILQSDNVKHTEVKEKVRKEGIRGVKEDLKVQTQRRKYRQGNQRLGNSSHYIHRGNSELDSGRTKSPG